MGNLIVTITSELLPNVNETFYFPAMFSIDDCVDEAVMCFITMYERQVNVGHSDFYDTIHYTVEEI